MRQGNNGRITSLQMRIAEIEIY